MSDATADDGDVKRISTKSAVRVVTGGASVSYKGRSIGIGVKWVGSRVVITEPKPGYVVVRDDATDAVIRELTLGPSGTHHGTGQRTTALQRAAGLRFAGRWGAVTYRRRNIVLGVTWAGKCVIVTEPKPGHIVVRDHATGALIRELDLGPVGTYHGTGARGGRPMSAPHTGPRTVWTSGALAYCGRTIYLGKEWIGKLVTVTVTEPEPDHAIVRDHATGTVIRELDLGPIGTHHRSSVPKPKRAQRKTGTRQVGRSCTISYGNRDIRLDKTMAGKTVIITEPKPDHVLIHDPATGAIIRELDLGPVGTYHGNGNPANRTGWRKPGPRKLVVTRTGAAVTYNGRNIGLGAAWAGKQVILDEPTPGRVVITDHTTGAVIRELELGPVGTYHGTGGKPGGVRKVPAGTYGVSGAEQGRRKSGPRELVVKSSGSVNYRGRDIALGRDSVGKRVVVTEPKPGRVVITDHTTGEVLRAVKLGPVGTYHGTSSRSAVLQRKAGFRSAGTFGAISYRARRIALGAVWAGKRVVVTEPKPDHVVITDHETGEVLRTVELGPVGTYHGLDSNSITTAYGQATRPLA